MNRRWTPEQVSEMRAMARAGILSSEIATKFGGWQKNVLDALRGVTFRDVPGWLSELEMRATLGRIDLRRQKAEEWAEDAEFRTKPVARVVDALCRQYRLDKFQVYAIARQYRVEQDVSAIDIDMGLHLASVHNTVVDLRRAGLGLPRREQRRGRPPEPSRDTDPEPLPEREPAPAIPGDYAR